MGPRLFVYFSLVAIACAQTPRPPSSAPLANTSQSAATSPATAVEATPEPPKVDPDDPVITIKGFCADSTLQGDACKTVITKAQFEKLTDTIQPGMAPSARRQFAMRYAQALTASSEAEKRGLDKTPQFEDAIRLARMQLLSQELAKSLQADAGNVSDQDIRAYYEKNAPNYEQATFVKIFVPLLKSGPKSGPTEEEKAGEEAMKNEASLLRDRLLKGEDPDKLEKAAFEVAGLPGDPPTTKVEKVRRSKLPAEQQFIMDLKPNEVSGVVSDASGNYIYRLVSKETLTLDTVRTEIHDELGAQRYREAIEIFQSSAELNDAYFGRAPAPRHTSRHRPRNKPAALPGNDD